MSATTASRQTPPAGGSVGNLQEKQTEERREPGSLCGFAGFQDEHVDTKR